jgi:hypothetical protein
LIKVFAMIAFQCAALYCVAMGSSRLAIDRQAAESASRAERRVASARNQLQAAQKDNRGVNAARQLEKAAVCAELAAQEQLAACALRDWPYRAILEWPKLME